MDYKKALIELEEKVETAKINKAKLEERLKKLKEDKASLLKEIEAEGFLVDDLDTDIAKLEKNIKEGIGKCQNILDGTDTETNKELEKQYKENKKTNEAWLKKHPYGTKENE